MAETLDPLSTSWRRYGYSLRLSWLFICVIFFTRAFSKTVIFQKILEVSILKMGPMLLLGCDWDFVLLVLLVFHLSDFVRLTLPFFRVFLLNNSRNYHIYSVDLINLKTISTSLLRLALHKINCFIYHGKSFPGHWIVSLQSRPFFIFFWCWTFDHIPRTTIRNSSNN